MSSPARRIRIRRLAAWLASLALAASGAAAQPMVESADVCVYAATPSGIAAAVAVKRAGRSVVIVEPSRWVGGMLGAGLKPMQDCPNFASTGGLARQWLQTLGGQEWEGDRLVRESMRRMSPLTLREDFLRILRENEIPVIYDHRIASCEKSGTTVVAALFDRAPFDALGCPVAEPEKRATLRIEARVFIDASYEGDLMPAAGVAFRIGREAASEFDEEPYAGVREPLVTAPIDPFVVPGNPASGLVKWVEADQGQPVGAADHYTQAYNYRYYTTDDPQFRAPIAPPDGYDPAEFEIVGRYVEHLVRIEPDEKRLLERLARIFPGWMNSGEWNYHRDSLITMAPLGISQEYAAGDAAAKARIWKAHQDYLRGLHAFLSTDDRVPEAFRRRTAELGLDRRHHPETEGWPHQLYIRVTRRLDGPYVITAHDVLNKGQVDDPIGLAQYGIDTYPARRIWFERDGRAHVGVEGNMFVGGGPGPTRIPYPVSYRAIVPKPAQCGNLLVPVCFSATHIGYASARMEPVFMICGESAGIAACRALEEGVSVQDIDRRAFRLALEEAGQKLVWEADDVYSRESDEGLTFRRLSRDADRDGDGRISRPEWDAAKPGWEWLFPAIDADSDGFIDAPEYDAFQRYKADHPDWLSRLRK